MTYGFPPKLEALDSAISALIDDLERDDLGERITVVLASEFGRTPRLNPSGGRDHWPRAQSVLMFGAGLRRGIVLGQTDARGEEPDGDAVSPADLVATLATVVRQNPRAVRSTSQLGRPIPVVEAEARVLSQVLA